MFCQEDGPVATELLPLRCLVAVVVGVGVVPVRHFMGISDARKQLLLPETPLLIAIEPAEFVPLGEDKVEVGTRADEFTRFGGAEFAGAISRGRALRRSSRFR
jgi:hypothetical protein